MSNKIYKTSSEKSFCDELLNFIPNECIKYTTDKNQKCKENKKEYIIPNQATERIAIIKLDKCVYANNSSIERCDFMVIRCSYRVVYLIELKGANLEHAYDQIISTYNELPKMGITNCIIHARIVPERVSALALRSSKQEKLRKLLRTTGGNLTIKTRNYVENF